MPVSRKGHLKRGAEHVQDDEGVLTNILAWPSNCPFMRGFRFASTEQDVRAFLITSGRKDSVAFFRAPSVPQFSPQERRLWARMDREG